MGKRRIERKRQEKLWMLVSGILGSISICFAFRSVFSIELNITEYGTGMLIFGIFWLPFVFLKRHIWIGYGVGIFPILLFFLNNYDEIRYGLIEGVIGNAMRSVGQYLNHQEGVTAISEGPRIITGGLLALCGLFLGVCMVIGSVRKMRVIIFLFYFAFFSFPFFNGVPIRPEGAFSIGSAVVALMIANPLRSGAQLMTTILAAMVIGSFIPRQGMEEMFADPTEWQNRIVSFLAGTSQGGVTDGKMGTTEGVMESGKLQLELTVSVKPVQSVYIQGFVGTDYEQNQWLASQDTGELSEREVQKVRESEYGSVARDKETLGVQMADVNITRIGAKQKYKYLPYKSRQIQPLYGDTYSEGEKKSYSVETILLREIGKMKAIPVSIADDQGKDVEKYTEFVYSRYLQVPEEFRKDWEKRAKSFQGQTLGSTVRNVADYLKNHAVYTKSPGKTPQGEDFIEYFLDDSRKGYCVHFASAGVLLLRLNGIPARFVSGYIVSPDQFYRSEDGTYKAELDDSTAHAWAEIYIEGYGWMPAEMTPSSGNGRTYETEDSPNRDTGVRSEETAESKTETDTDTEQNSRQDNSLNREKEQQMETETNTDKGVSSFGSLEESYEEKEDNERVINQLVLDSILLLVMAAGILALMRQRKWRCIRKKKSRRGKYLDVYRILYGMIQFDLKSEIPEEIGTVCLIIDQVYGIPKDQVANIIETVLETAFGNGEPDREDLRKLRELTRNIRGIILKKQGIFRKFLFVFWKGY